MMPSTSLNQRTSSAFTLLELLVVIGIISILLVAIVPAVNSLSKSNGRKAAITGLVAAVEQARAQAIKSGEATYIVFPTFGGAAAPTTLQRYNHRSYALFEADPGKPAQPKQATNWKSLPTGVSIRQLSLAALPAASALPTPVTITFSPDTAAAPAFQCVQFNASGAIESPNNNVTLVVFEGFVSGTNEIVTSRKDSNGNPIATDSVTISHLTGRVSYSNL